MRRRFRNLLIRRKLTMLMTLTSCLTLLVTGLAWFTYDWKTSRDWLVQEVAVIAKTVGQNVAPAIYFDQNATGQDDLGVLEFHHSVERAEVFSPDGQPLMSYTAPGFEGDRLPLPFRREGIRFEGSSLVYYTPVYYQGEELGTICIEANLSLMQERIMDIAGIVLLALALSTAVAFLLANSLQRVISEPLVDLSETLRAVSLRKDYSLRAVPHGRDEIGFLTESFNGMLDSIQTRDALLERAKDGLAEKVEQRTRELTERNEQLRVSMEEARGAAVAKSQFLANMSHEIRTPMNGVLGMTDLLLETPLSDQQRSYAEIVRGSAETLLEIINDILDFSKIEAGKMRLERIEFDPSQAIEEVVGLLASPARKKGLTLACLVAPEVPRVLIGDPVRFRQVVTNLVGNAVKFTEEGRVTVRVGLDPERSEAATGEDGEGPDWTLLRVEVEDSGIGIPEDRVDRLFRSFSQVDSSMTRRFGGTGLGLAISAQLVELMGGKIGVESRLEHGSTFWFTVRLGIVPDSLARSFVLPAGLEPPRVLVVEPSSAVREVLHHQLAVWEIQHEAVPDAPQAVDLVPLDQELLEQLSLSELRGDEDQAEPTRLVRLTWGAGGEGATEESRALPELGMPVRPSQLFDTVVQAARGESGPVTVERPRVRPPAVPLPLRARLRVLLAEDNRINQVVAGKILSRAGYAFDVAADGREAVEAVERQRYDVILMDCQMPTIDGFEATRRIRALEEQAEPGLRPAHIVALTANAMKGDRERCMRCGMNDYLCKPVRPDELVAMLDAQVRLRHDPEPGEEPPGDEDRAA